MGSRAVVPLWSGTAACDPSAVVPQAVRYYRWGEREREKGSLKEAEDQAEVPGPQRYYCCGATAGLPLRSGIAACGFSAVLPLGARYCRLDPDRTRKRGEISSMDRKSSKGEKLMCT